MKVMMTGASGFIGSYVISALLELDIDVITIGRNYSSMQVSYHDIDLLATKELSDLMTQERPTHLLHLAWEATHGKYWTSAVNLRWVDSTSRLVEAFCLSGGKHVILAGTCAEYDWSFGYCMEECTPLNPTTLYGVAKDSSRRLAEAICDQYDVSCCCGRLFLAFGPGEARSRLIPSLIDFYHGISSPFAINIDVYRDFCILQMLLQLLCNWLFQDRLVLLILVPVFPLVLET